MSQLAPGRRYDMAMLLERRDQTEKYSAAWNKIQLKIEDLVEEGKCPTIRRLRERLLNAAKASDNDQVVNISEQIDEHMKRSHRRRFERAWLKKG